MRLYRMGREGTVRYLERGWFAAQVDVRSGLLERAGCDLSTIGEEPCRCLHTRAHTVSIELGEA